MNPPSPPRRVASRVRTLDGGDAQAAVAEVVLENYGSEEELFAGATIPRDNAKKKSGHSLGIKRFQSSPTAGEPRRVSSLFKRGVETKRTDSSNDDSSASSSPSQCNGHDAQILEDRSSPLNSEPAISPNSSDGKSDINNGLQNDNSEEAKSKSFTWKRILIGISFLASMGGVGVGSYFLCLFFFPSPTASTESEQSVSAESSNSSYIFDDGTTKREQPEPSDAANNVIVHASPILTATSNGTSITFYVMADAPYSDYERTDIMPQQIANLPQNNNINDSGASPPAFLAHLGDLQYAKIDMCQEHAYRNASDILKKSPMPVFVLPGDNDINDCDELEHGKAMWRQHFNRFDQLWDHEFEVTRWGELEESFAFLHNHILFLGLNIVGGSPHSYTEWRARHAVHLNNVKSIMTAHEDDFLVAVLLGHASPVSYHDDFFVGEDGFAEFINKTGKPFLHLHGDDHNWHETEGAFGVSNYMMVSLDAGESAPPIKVEVDASKANPITIDRVESGLEVECCSDGWPRLSNQE